MGRYVLSFDLGGTNVRCGILDEEGNILARAKTSTADRPAPQEAARRMAEIGDQCCRQFGVARSSLACAGVGSPGPLNSQTGMVFETPNLGWKDVPLTRLMEEALNLPVFLENDANAACWGEYWKGIGRGVKTMFILTLGTGVGGGLILNGEVWRGPDDTAGHLGHMVVDPDGPTQNFDNPGSVEALCSATACIRDARAVAQAHPESLLARTPLKDITGKVVSECADQGDPYAQEILRRIGVNLGIACASLANALNPELGVIGGGLAFAGDKILVPLRRELKRRALGVPGARLRIELARLGDDSGLVGAAGLALRRLAQRDSARA